MSRCIWTLILFTVLFGINSISPNKASAQTADSVAVETCMAGDLAFFNGGLINPANSASVSIGAELGAPCYVGSTSAAGAVPNALLDDEITVIFGQMEIGDNTQELYLAVDSFAASGGCLNGASFAADTPIPLTPGATHAIKYNTGAVSWSFSIIINADNTIDASGDINFTIGSIPATSCIDGPTESDILAAQQDFFTALIIKHQTQILTNSVNQNVISRLNGGGVGPQITANGFFLQSTGLGTWMNQREAEQLLRQDRIESGRSESNVIEERANSQPNDGSERVVDAAYGLESGNLSGLTADPEWNFWIRGEGTRYDDKGSSFDGTIFDVIAGIDRKMNDRTVLGVLAGYGTSDFDTVIGGTAGGFDATGFHIGAYGGAKLTDMLTFDALIAYTSSKYDNTSGATTGSFDADRITVAAHLTGSMHYEHFILNPIIGLMYASERQSAWTDSALVVHAAQTITAGRLSVGPKITFNAYEIGTTTMQPWVAANWEYDFTNSPNIPASGLPDLDDLSSARLSGGFSARMENGATLAMQVDSFGLGSGEYTAIGGSVGLSVPF